MRTPLSIAQEQTADEATLSKKGNLVIQSCAIYYRSWKCIVLGERKAVVL